VFDKFKHHDMIKAMLKQALMQAIDSAIESVRKHKYDICDYVGVLEVSIIGHATLPRHEKLIGLQKVAELEWDLTVGTGLITEIPGFVSKTAYVDAMIRNHIKMLDQIDDALAQIERDVANLPMPDNIDLDDIPVPEILHSNKFDSLLRDLATGAAKPKHG
jgi:hypothetical protein